MNTFCNQGRTFQTCCTIFFIVTSFLLLFFCTLRNYNSFATRVQYAIFNLVHQYFKPKILINSQKVKILIKIHLSSHFISNYGWIYILMDANEFARQILVVQMLRCIATRKSIEVQQHFDYIRGKLLLENTGKNNQVLYTRYA